MSNNKGGRSTIGDYASGYHKKGSIYGLSLVEIQEPIPLVGHIAFGVIDRGTNIIQVRPSTLCPHNCIYCSVDAGPRTATRQTELLVEPYYLSRWVHKLAEFKNIPVEALIDGVGEPLTHPKIYDLIWRIKNHKLIRTVAVETHGGFLSKNLLNKLYESGLDRINLSIDTVDQEKARSLAGVKWYNVSKILNLIDWALENTGLDIVLTPVVVPGYNDSDIVELIKFAKSRKLGNRSGWPTGILIQKYELHRYGRKPRGVRPWSWKYFYQWLAKLEKETGYLLRPRMEDIGIVRARKLPEPYRKGEKVSVILIGEGWRKGEILGVDHKGLRVFAVYCNDCRIGQRVTVKVVRSKDNIFVAVK